MLRAVREPNALTLIDVSGQGNATIAVGDLVGAVCEVMSRAGNGLRTLRLGGNGAWGKGVSGPLVEALSSAACVLEELDVGGSGMKREEATRLSAAALTRGIKTLTLDGWKAPLGDDASSTLAVPSDASLREADGAVLCELLKARSGYTTLEVRGEASAAGLKLVCEGLEATPSRIAALNLGGLRHMDATSSATTRLTSMLRAVREPNALTLIDVSGQRDATIAVGDLVGAVCEVMSRAGNGLRTLRLGGNGAWGKGVSGPLVEALSSAACVLEELDVGGSGMKREEATRLSAAALTRGIKTLTLDGWKAPLGDDASSTLAVPSLREADGAVLCELLKARSGYTTLEVRGAASAAGLKLVCEALEATPSRIAALNLGGLRHVDETSSATTRLTSMLRAVREPNALTLIDVSGQRDATIAVGDLVGAVCEVMSRAGNGLRTLRLGGNGAWGKGVSGPLVEALSSAACVLEELDVGGSGMKREEATRLSAAALTRGIKTLTLDGWKAPLGDDASSTLAVPSDASLREADVAVLCELLKARSGYTTLEVRGEASAAGLKLVCEALEATPSRIAALNLGGLRHVDATSSATTRLTSMLRAVREPNALTLIDVSGQRDATIAVGDLVGAVCEVMSRAGNGLRTLRLGGNGAWGKGVSGPLVEALSSAACRARGARRWRKRHEAGGGDAAVCRRADSRHQDADA